MKISMRVAGAEELAAQLRYGAVQKVPDGARKIMHRSADKIVKEAALNAPVDKHNLEESIQKEVSYGNRGRLQIDVAAGGVVNGVDVDDYATEMHENYESYNPGKGTMEKRQANPGRYVGGRFLARAVEEEAKVIQEKIRSGVSKILNALVGGR